MLVTGGTGQLGTAFRALLPDARFPARETLDLAQPSTLVAALRELEPSAIVNCAAYTAVDRAEEEEELATVINGESVGVLAEFAGHAGIPFVTFSTDYVFDGAATAPYVESDSPGPINAYGRSKLTGEGLALQSGGLVIRTSWVLSKTHRNFVATMLRLANGEDDIHVVDDQVGCPTFADDLAAAALGVFDAGATGLLHLTNSGSTSWFDLARSALAAAGHDPGRVHPITSADYPTVAMRPRYSVLGSERRETLGVGALPHWEESLPGVVQTLGERPPGPTPPADSAPQ